VGDAITDCSYQNNRRENEKYNIMAIATTT
jgi:hypothetical protein